MEPCLVYLLDIYSNLLSNSSVLLAGNTNDYIPFQHYHSVLQLLLLLYHNEPVSLNFSLSFLRFLKMSSSYPLLQTLLRSLFQTLDASNDQFFFSLYSALLSGIQSEVSVIPSITCYFYLLQFIQSNISILPSLSSVWSQMEEQKALFVAQISDAQMKMKHYYAQKKSMILLKNPLFYRSHYEPLLSTEVDRCLNDTLWSYDLLFSLDTDDLFSYHQALVSSIQIHPPSEPVTVETLLGEDHQSACTELLQKFYGDYLDQNFPFINLNILYTLYDKDFFLNQMWHSHQRYLWMNLNREISVCFKSQFKFRSTVFFLMLFDL